MKSKRRVFLIYNACLLLFLAGVLLYWLLLRRAGLPFRCAFWESLHLYCPGCGATRAMEALLCGRVLLSLSYNPLALLLPLCALYYEVSLFPPVWRRRAPLAWPALTLSYFALGFFLLRNLFFFCFGIDSLGDLTLYWS